MCSGYEFGPEFGACVRGVSLGHEFMWERGV